MVVIASEIKAKINVVEVGESSTQYFSKNASTNPHFNVRV